MAYRSHTVTLSTGASSLTPALPSGVVADDVLIMACLQGGSTTAVHTWPSGFTEGPALSSNAAGGQTARWAWKIATGSEPSTYTFSSSVGDHMTLILAAYSGRATTTPVSASSTSGVTTGSSGPPINVTAPTITPGVDNCDVLWFGGMSPSSATMTTAPSGMTSRVASGTQYSNLALADLTQSTATATGALTGTYTGSGGGYCAFAIALAPYVAPTTSGAIVSNFFF